MSATEQFGSTNGLTLARDAVYLKVLGTVASDINYLSNTTLVLRRLS